MSVRIGWVQPQRVADMKFAQADASVAKPPQRGLRILKLHGKMAAALRCSKATARRRLLALGQRLRALVRRESGRFFADRPASHLPSGTGAKADRG